MLWIQGEVAARIDFLADGLERFVPCSGPTIANVPPAMARERAHIVRETVAANAPRPILSPVRGEEREATASAHAVRVQGRRNSRLPAQARPRPSLW